METTTAIRLTSDFLSGLHQEITAGIEAVNRLPVGRKVTGKLLEQSLRTLARNPGTFCCEIYGHGMKQFMFAFVLQNGDLNPRMGYKERLVFGAVKYFGMKRAEDENVSFSITRLDRLGRSTRDVLSIVHELDTKGAFLRVMDRNIDTSKPEGKLILTVFSMVSEMELSFIRERQKVGIGKAKAKGVYRGRPASIETDRLLELKAKGLGATAIARELGCTRSAVYKALERIAG